MIKVAALYVAEKGCYFGLDDVDPWPESRDARLYAGPHPVVAHPPCQRWGNYWFGSPSSTTRYQLGDDGGCFKAALAAVRRWGGVLEHPEGSRAWAAHDLLTPPRGGGWVSAGDGLGWTCCIEQGNYGHRARKPTWLYMVGALPPLLMWRRSASSLAAPPVALWSPCRCCSEFWCSKHLAHAFECPCPPIEEHETDPYATRQRGQRSSNDAIERMGKRERLATPLPFRDLLLSIARSVTHGT